MAKKETVPEVSEVVVTPREFEKIIVKLIEIPRMTIICQGRPGGAKTAIPKQVAEKLGIGFHLIEPVTMSEVEARGLPCPNGDGFSEWRPFKNLIPPDLPERGILVIDELMAAEPQTAKAFAPLLHPEEHRLGDRALPPGWMVIATGNRTSDRAGSNRLLTHIRSRCHFRLTLEPDAIELATWGATTGRLAPEICSYLQFAGNGAFTFDPNSDTQDANPRTYERLSEIFKATPDDLRHKVFLGCIGPKAVEVIAFLQTYASISEDMIELIFADPKKAALPDKMDILYAMTGSLADHCKDRKPKDWEAAATYCLRMPRELATVFMINLARVTKMKCLGSKAFDVWFDQPGTREACAEALCV